MPDSIRDRKTSERERQLPKLNVAGSIPVSRSKPILVPVVFVRNETATQSTYSDIIPIVLSQVSTN